MTLGVVVVSFFGADRLDETSETQFVANNRNKCEKLRGGLQDFLSLATSRRAQKKEKVSRQGRHSRSLTRFTWELQTGTENFNSLTSLTNRGLNTRNSNAVRRGS